jgi:hypothetical protein
LASTSHCPSILCILVVRREFSWMRNMQFASASWAAVMLQRVLSAFYTFSEQPNHNFHQLQAFATQFLGHSQLLVRTHLFTFPTHAQMPYRRFFGERRLISNFPHNRLSQTYQEPNRGTLLKTVFFQKNCCTTKIRF